MIFRSFFLLALLAMAGAAAAAEAPKPNILVILADDLGYGDAQCYNPSRGKIPTPNIDKFATQGMLFTDAHASTSVCSPSRYALLTGRFPWRTRLQSYIVGLWGPPLIAPDRLTIADVLKQHGYRTAMFGKWHLGDEWHIAPGKLPLFNAKPAITGAKPTEAELAAWKEAFSQPIGGGPVAHGFDTYFGTDVPNWPPFAFIQDDRVQGIPTAFLPLEALRRNMASVQGPAMAGWKLEDVLPAVTSHACDYIEQSPKQPEPFFIYLALPSPHVPLAVLPKWRGKSGLDNDYADYVMQTDEAVGRVLAALDKSGEAGNTLVVFTSDNGFAYYVGGKQLEAEGHFPSGPLRGYKFDAYEGGHREPFIVRWPGSVKPGTKSDQLIEQADLMATFADILGVKLPDHAGEDSFSVLPILRGDDRPVHDFIINASSPGVLAVRRGPWKFIAGSGGADGKKSKGELYNLSNDLGEKKNLYAENPALVAGMMALLEKAVDDGRTTPGPREANDVHVAWKRFLLKPGEPAELPKKNMGITSTEQNLTPYQKFALYHDWSWMHDD